MYLSNSRGCVKTLSKRQKVDNKFTKKELSSLELGTVSIKIKNENADKPNKIVRLNKTLKNDLAKYLHSYLFFEGALVFAKLRGHRPWPAKVVQVFPRGKYEVECYFNLTNIIFK